VTAASLRTEATVLLCVSLMVFISASASTNSSHPWPDFRTGCVSGWGVTNTSASAVRGNRPKILEPLIAACPASVLRGGGSHLDFPSPGFNGFDLAQLLVQPQL